MPVSSPRPPAVAAALADLAYWRRRIAAAAPVLTADDARRLRTAERRAADIRAWLRPPGVGRAPLPPGLCPTRVAAAVAYLRGLQRPPDNASLDLLGQRLRPGHPAVAVTPAPVLATAAFLTRHAPADAHPDQAWRAARTAYPLRQPTAQAVLRWSVRYAETLLEQTRN